MYMIFKNIYCVDNIYYVNGHILIMQSIHFRILNLILSWKLLLKLVDLKNEKNLDRFMKLA